MAEMKETVVVRADELRPMTIIASGEVIRQVESYDRRIYVTFDSDGKTIPYWPSELFYCRACMDGF